MIIPFHGKSKADQAAEDAASEGSDTASVWSLGLENPPPPYSTSTTLAAPAYASASASGCGTPYGLFPQYTTHDQPVLLSLKRGKFLASRTDVTVLKGPDADPNTPILSYTGTPVIGDVKAMVRRNQQIVLSDAKGAPLMSLHHTMYSREGWVAVQPGMFHKASRAVNLGALADCTSCPPGELFHVVKRSGFRFRSALVLPANLGGEPVQCDIRTQWLKAHHKIKDPQGGKCPLVLIKEHSGIKTDALVEVAPHFDLAVAVAVAIICIQQTQEAVVYY